MEDPPKDPPPLTIAASALGSYFHFHCNRYLHLAASPAARAAHSAAHPPAPRLPPPDTHLRRAILARGDAWERDILRLLRAKGSAVVDCLDAAGPGADRAAHLAASLAALADAQPGQVLFQVRFALSQQEAADWLAHPAYASGRLRFAHCIADFVFVLPDGSLLVVDAKASPAVKLSHRVQVAFYALVLDRLGHRVAPVGGVWLQGAEVHHEFSLAEVKLLLTEALSTRIPRILAAPRDWSDQDWHLTPTCRACPHLQGCYAQADATRSIAAVPYLSPQDARWLRSWMNQRRAAHGLAETPRTTDIEDLAAILPKSLASADLSVDARLRLDTALAVPYLLSPAPVSEASAAPARQTCDPPTPAPQTSEAPAPPEPSDAPAPQTSEAPAPPEPSDAPAPQTSEPPTPAPQTSHAPAHALSSSKLNAFLRNRVELSGRPSLALPASWAVSLIIRLCIHPDSHALFGYVVRASSKDEVIAHVADCSPDTDLTSGFVAELSRVLRDLVGRKVATAVFLATAADVHQLVDLLLKAAMGTADAAESLQHVPALRRNFSEAATASTSGSPRTPTASLRREPSQALAARLASPAALSPDLPAHRALYCLSVLVQQSTSILAPQLIDLSPQKGRGVPQVTSRPRLLSLESEVAHLVSLPVPAFYSLRDMYAWLHDSDVEPAAAQEILESHPSFEPDAHYDLLHSDDLVALEELLNQGACIIEDTALGLAANVARLAGPDRLPHILPNRALVLREPPFVQRRDQDLSRLSFLWQYENVVASHQYAQERAHSIGVKTARYNTLLLRALDDSPEGGSPVVPFAIEAGAHWLDTSADSFQEWLLVPVVDGHEDPSILKFNDLVCDIKPVFNPSLMLASANIMSFLPGDDRSNPDVAHLRSRDPAGNNWVLVRVRIANVDGSKPKTRFRRVQNGARYVLQRRYVNANDSKAQEILETLDDRLTADPAAPPLFLRLLRHPGQWGALRPAVQLASPTPTTDAGSDSDLPIPMTESQRGIFDQLATQSRLQVVWGPPGSGKSYFAAATVLNLLARAARTDGREFRILVSAFTRTALDNLLRKIASLLGKTDLGDEILASVISESAAKEIRAASKAGRPAAAPPYRQLAVGGKSAPAQRALVDFVAQRICVLGGTAWQLNKVRRTFGAECPMFDMLVVDEASQVRLVEAAFMMDNVDPDRGRLLVVGDPYQMAPIVRSEYPVPETGRPALHMSFLDYLMALVRQDNVDTGDADTEGSASSTCTGKLRENHRMSDNLCTFTQGIYGSDYRPSEYVQRRQHLNITLSAIGDFPGIPAGVRSALDRILDPQNPLVLVELRTADDLEVASLSDAQLLIEAALVRTIMQGFQRAGQHKEAVGAEAFVVTPHHAQRRAVGDALRQDDGLAGIVVDTVERMQGQERDFVVVCYSVLSDEGVEREMDFLYNRNRINVALSRARSKAVLLTADRVLWPPLTVLSTEARQEGFMFLNSIGRSPVCTHVVLEVDDELMRWSSKAK